MELSENANIVLRRCKLINCVSSGQAFSVGLMESDLGGRQIAGATMTKMSTAGLLSPGLNGTYILTSLGAEAVSIVANKKTEQERSGGLRARRSGSNHSANGLTSTSRSS